MPTPLVTHRSRRPSPNSGKPALYHFDFDAAKWAPSKPPNRKVRSVCGFGHFRGGSMCFSLSDWVVRALSKMRPLPSQPSAQPQCLGPVIWRHLCSAVGRRETNTDGVIYLALKHPYRIGFDTHNLSTGERRHQPTLEMVENVKEVGRYIRMGIHGKL